MNWPAVDPTKGAMSQQAHNDLVATSPAASRGGLLVILGILIVAIAVLNVRQYRGFTIDDPWITYRYAENLVAGKGFVFNPGDRLESFSSFTHVFLLAAVRLITAEIDKVGRALGVLAHLATIVLLLIASWRFNRDRPLAFHVIAPLLLALSPSAAAWAVGGLETPFVGLLLLATLLVYQREETQPTGFRWSAVLLFLVALTRVEGALVFFCLAAHQAWKWYSGNHTIERRTVIWAGTFVVLFGAYTAWRWTYFGDLLPNTYYAKATGPLLHQWIAGLKYCLAFAIYLGVLPLFFCLVPLFQTEARSRTLPWILVIAGYGGFIFHCGGDWMPFYRFFVHILPLILWLFQEGVWEASNRAAPDRRKLMGACIVVAVLAAVCGNAMLYRREIAPILGRVKRGTLIRQYFDVAEYLKREGSPDQLVAGSEAGVIPYVSGMRFLDIVGVLDRHIARTKGGLHRKSDPGYVLRQKPDWIVLHALPQKVDGQWFGLTPAGNDLLRHAEFDTLYSLEKTFERGDGIVGVDLFLVFKKRPVS